MNINNKSINIDDLISDNYMHFEVKKGIFLSKHQLEILRKNYIEIDDICSINDLIYELDALLDEEYDEELENILIEISEYNYYNNTNK